MPVGPRHRDQFLMRYTRPAASDVGDNGGNGSPVLAEDCRAERLTAVRFVPLIGAHGFGSGR